MSTEESTNNVSWVEYVEPQFSTKKFSELKPGQYTVIPLRRINTKFGYQLICQIFNHLTDSIDSTEEEYLVPNSFTKQLKTVCGSVEHKCMLKLISSDLTGKIPKYNFQIGKLKDNPVVSIERPIQESSW